MRWLALGCALLLGSITSLGHAQPQAPQLSAEERARAVQLADEGARLFERGDFNGARERFEQAEQIAPIPPFTLQRARALEKLGRWTEAATLYERVATVALTKDAPIQHTLAKKDAEKALVALGPRIPRVTVTTTGDEVAEVFVDGRSVGAAGTAARAVDPGEHVVEARGRNGRIGRRTIQIKESESIAVELQLAPAPDPSVPPRPDDGPSLWTILGYVGMSVGGASLVAAAATGIPAIMMRSDLDTACPDGRCPPSEFDAVDTYDALRWAAGGTLIAGLVLAGAGVTSFLLAPEQGIFGGEVKAEVGLTTLGLRVTLP